MSTTKSSYDLFTRCRKREQALIIESKGTREVATRAVAGERCSSVLR
jgi:hypothetical protein